MTKVSIIGVGLIGGSLGMALKAARKYRVAGLGRDIDKLKLAKKLGAIDEYFMDWEQGVKDADIVVVCTPVDLIAGTIKKILPFTKPGAVITDAGSVKGSVVASSEKVLRNIKGRSFVGGHPLAGLEKTGVKNADKKLYCGAGVVVTPGRDKTAAAKIKRMWVDAGAEVFMMNPAAHDKIVSGTSHLPHVLAFLLCRQVEKIYKTDPRTAKLLAGSFRDMTRIADSSTSDWAVISSANRQALGKSIDEYVSALKAAKKLLSSPKKLHRLFDEAKTARQNLLNIKDKGLK